MLKHRYVFCKLVVIQSLSRVQLFATPWIATHQASLSFTISWSLLKLMSIESVMSSNHLILCRPLLFLPSIFPSIRVFSNELAFCIRWLKCWSFSISPSNEYSGLISFRMDWLDLLAAPDYFLDPLNGSQWDVYQHRAHHTLLSQCFPECLVRVPGSVRAKTVEPTELSAHAAGFSELRVLKRGAKGS